MSSHPLRRALAQASLTARTGRVRRILPTHLEADGPHVPRGALCSIETLANRDQLPRRVMAQVVSVSRDGVILSPFEDGPTTFPGARVEAWEGEDLANVGDGLCGRVVDALGRPLDDQGPIPFGTRVSLSGEAISPLARTSPAKVLETGVRAIDVLLTLGVGQRIGVFAPSGVGKTSLMTQLANQTACDRCILCLVGERGREVEALWSQGLSQDAKHRTTIVAATSDQSAVMRARAVDYALTLAEHWRSDGHQVLLFIDSMTRYAMALREIGLAAGEPPTVRAYTPSVFAMIPKLVERCGALKSGGSISAVMTVLSENEDNDDPICEMMKSLLDGHVILSRSLAEQGHFPAIDVPRSISRLASGLMDDSHRQWAESANGLLSTYDASRMLIETGVYAAGSSAVIDRAVALRPGLLSLLRQGRMDKTPFSAAREALGKSVREAA